MVRDLTGLRFGRLTVIARATDNVCPSGYRTAMWLCRCDCGKETIVRGKSLTGGVTKSCGCLQKELLSRRASRHHGYGTRLYSIWDSMRQRCLNPKNSAYGNYGERGIKICKEWDDFSNFREWAVNSGYDESAPRGMYTLDRIDVGGDYYPDNCRWSNMREQTNNRRMTIYITYAGVRRPLSEWCSDMGINYSTAWRRYRRGLTPAEILKK